jgi:hypothetical protein
MKPDYPKIVFVGIPLLLMLWAAVFLSLAFATHDMFIAMYGAFVFFIVSIPTYGYLARRYALALRAVVEDNAQIDQNQSSPASSRNRMLSSRDLWILCTPVVLMFAGILIAQLIFHETNKEVIRFMSIGLPIVLVVEVVFKKLFVKTRKQNNTKPPNQAL